MSPEEASKLAHDIAEAARLDEARAKEEKLAAKAVQGALFPLSTPDVTDLPTPMYLHEEELGKAIRAASLLASGRNPYGDFDLERITHAQSVEMVRALSIVVCTMLGAPKFQETPESGSSFGRRKDSSQESPSHMNVPTPEKKETLEEYLDRVEREALLGALKESGNNKTAAARLLGITFRAMRYRLARLGMDE